MVGRESKSRVQTVRQRGGDCVGVVRGSEVKGRRVEEKEVKDINLEEKAGKRSLERGDTEEAQPKRSRFAGFCSVM